MQGKELTPVQKQKFLAKLSSAAGNVSKAAKAAGIARNTAYDHKKADADFSQAWDNVIDDVVDAAEAELYRRAVKGVVKPVFFRGEKVATIREFSDSNLQFLLKGKRPDIYRERMDINNNIQGSLDVNIEHEIDRIYGKGTDKPDDNPDES